MKKSYITLALKSALGITVILGIFWLVKCQCINLKSLTPASIRDYMQGFGKLAAIIYVLAYVLNTISIIPPIAPLSLTAGLAFGSASGALYLMLGAMIGTSLTFMISRLFGRDLIAKVSKGRFKNLDEKLEKNGFTTVLFFRVVPIVPYEVLNYAGGLSRIRFKDYFWATFLGLIPGVIIAAFFGGSLGEVKGITDLFTPRFLIAVGFMILIITVPLVYRRVRNRRVI